MGIPKKAVLETEKLKRLISSCENKIEYFKNKICDYATLGEFQSALSRLKSAYTQFEVAKNDLEQFGDEFVVDRTEFEDMYGAVESDILDRIAQLNVQAPNIKNPNALTGNQAPPQISLRIPEIPLPKFDGLEENWLKFRGIYNDLFHSNVQLTDIAKFHYLLTCIRDGKAYQLIQPIPLSGENYQKAYQSLFNYYDNEVKIQKIHMKKLYDIKKPIENSASSLQAFLDTVTKHYNSLKSLKVPVEHWNLFLSHHLCERLDDSSRAEIIMKSNLTEVLKFDSFVEILQTRVRVLEAKKPSVVSHSNSHHMNKPDARKPVNVFVEQNFNCPFCKENHRLDSCPKFRDSSVKPQYRFNFVKRRGACVSCLGDGHKTVNCKSVCAICSQKHHTLLHFGQTKLIEGRPSTMNQSAQISESKLCSNSDVYLPSKSDTIKSARDDSNEVKCIPKNLISATSEVTNSKMVRERNSSQILLSTAVLWVQSAKGGRIPCRALLDSGSQANFITTKMVQMLGLKVKSTNVKISGINNDITTVTKQSTINIESQKSDYKTSVDCLVKHKIAGIIPHHPVNINANIIPKSIQLADPWFFKPDSIDLLLGAELFLEIMKPEKNKMVCGIPLQNSEFGYVVMGRVSDNPQITNTDNDLSSFHVSLEELNDQIESFWRIEEVNSPNKLSLEEKLCEEHYVQNVRRDENGRYIVALPLKQNLENLGDSSFSALRQFYSLEKRLVANHEIYHQYNQFMTEYKELNHMVEAANPNSSKLKGGSYFMPHHSVVRESSSTTKLRVVFNASSKTSTGISLNDCLMIGPTIQQDLYSIILRFRKHIIGITGDIAKMYRQILIKDDQQELQKIWWRESQDVETKCYNLRTVTYGTASAPFLAIRTLYQLAADEEKEFTEASRVLKSDFYVDDLLTGSNSVETASTLKSEIIRLLSRGGFELRKIKSNDPSLQSEDCQEQSKSISILGMNWDTEKDVFYFSFKKYSLTGPYSKRSVLSEIAQLFDPLGFCGPIVFLAKLFMQSLWSLELDWDSDLPLDLQEYWKEFKRQLLSIDKLSISRCVMIPRPKRIELHGFGDASQKGFGCCIYIRTVDQENNCNVTFLCAKSRVAPLKSQTIPRLELCASLLLSQLGHKVLTTMEINFSAIYLWTDSEITLYRIRSVPSRFVTFVANRVSQIQDLTSPENWYYVPTDVNPSDKISRGLMPNDFLKCEEWFRGPSFLWFAKENWPNQPSTIEIDAEKLELKKIKVCVSEQNNEWDAISNCSNYSKLLRKFALILRFVNNMKSAVQNRNLNQSQKNLRSFNHRPSIKIELTALEIELALKAIVIHIQQSEFSAELKLLRKGKMLPKQSKLLPLNPFLGQDNILRVGGRLKNSNIPEESKHQYLLPASHSFSQLMVRSEHVRLLHAGPQSLLYHIRERFWIIGGRNLCKKVVKQCVRCFRTKPKTLSQIMGQLPKERVTPSRPFENIGIDYCGPFTIRPKLRSRVEEKGYVAIFICFASKAVHMEIVTELSTEAFLAAFRRFVSRRGLCLNVYSDNATNFVGAKSELQELHKLFTSEIHHDKIVKFCIDRNIQWHMIPPRSPHFGGLWEAAVKSAKFHLKRVVGLNSLTFEQLNTLIIEIEGCLNSRPIGFLSDDPNDLACLTPGHFLIGQPITSLPDPSVRHLSFNRLSHYQKLQSMFQNFWVRWSREYLCELQYRRKWNQIQPEPKLNDVVILKEDNVPPFKWPLARITELHRGKDGIVRVVTIQVGNKIFKRAITRICPLPIEMNSTSPVTELVSSN